MKIIELLNMISKGEEVPKKIKYKNKIYEWKEYDVCYGKIMTKKGWVKELGYVAEENRTYFYLKHCFQDLNDEVEIIEPQFTEEEIKEYTNKFLEVWTPIKQQFGELFDEIIRIKNDLGLNLEDNIKEEPQEHKIPEKLPYYSLEKIQKAKNKDEWREERISLLEERVNDYHNKINEIIDYLEEIE